MCLSKICLISLVVFFCAANAFPSARLRRSVKVNSLESEVNLATTTQFSPQADGYNPGFSGVGKDDISSSEGPESDHMPTVNQDLKHEDASALSHPDSEQSKFSGHNIAEGHIEDDAQKHGSENSEELKNESPQTEEEHEYRPKEGLQGVQGHPPVDELMLGSQKKKQSQEATEKAVEKSGDQKKHNPEADPQTVLENGHLTEKEVEHKNEEPVEGLRSHENHKEESLNSNQAETSADLEEAHHSGAQTHSIELPGAKVDRNEFTSEYKASEEQPKESLNGDNVHENAEHIQEANHSEESEVEHKSDHSKAPKSLEEDSVQESEGAHIPKKTELDIKSADADHIAQSSDAENVPEEIENHEDSEQSEQTEDEEKQASNKSKDSENSEHSIVPDSVEQVDTIVSEKEESENSNELPEHNIVPDSVEQVDTIVSEKEESENSNELPENKSERTDHLEGSEEEPGNVLPENNDAHPEESDRFIDPLKEVSKEHVHPEEDENSLPNQNPEISSEKETSSDEAFHLGSENSVSEVVGEPDHQSEGAIKPEATVEPTEEHEEKLKPEELVEPTKDNEGAVGPEAAVESTEESEEAVEPSAVENGQAADDKPIVPSPARSLFGGLTHNAFNIDQKAGDDAKIKINNITN